jgi:ABC-type dipeptide/oligopeptide/nickel transport system permease component
MSKFLLTRLGLALVTLVLVSIIVFAVAEILPGDVGR